MTEQKSRFDNYYQKLNDWLMDVQSHEIKSLVALIENAKAHLAAAEALPEERVKQFVDNIHYDLHQFYQQYQSDAKHSVYLGLLSETFWANLAKMTDKSQVEWAELLEDFDHQGEYQAGDFIGFGILECQQCHQRLTINHLSEVPTCPQCGGSDYLRHGFAP